MLKIGSWQKSSANDVWRRIGGAWTRGSRDKNWPSPDNLQPDMKNDIDIYYI